MQATRALRVAATAVARSGAHASDDFVNKAVPNLTKQWKSYTYTRNQRIQQLSPFEIDVIGPLFRNVGEKIKHKVEDNFFDVAPPLLFFVGLVTLVKWKRSQDLLHHRD